MAISQLKGRPCNAVIGVGISQSMRALDAG